MTRRRIFEERRRRILAAEGPIVAQIDPDAACPGLLLRQNRHGGVVGVNAFGGKNMLAKNAKDRIKGDDAGAATRSASVDGSISTPSRA